MLRRMFSMMLLLQLAALASLSSARAFGQEAQLPSGSTHTLSGQLLEFYTGRPYVGTTLVAESKWWGFEQGVKVQCDLPAQEVETDAQGRFQFGNIPTCPEYAQLMVKSTTPLIPVVTPEGEGVFVDVVQTDVGTVFLANDDWATAQFASLCAGEEPSEVPPLSNLVVLSSTRYSSLKKPRWTSSYYKNQELLTKEILPWEGVLCLEHKETKLGTYGADAFAGGGYSRTTSATLVRQEDGKTFRTTVTAQPPERASSTKIGNTRPMIIAWLKEIANNNP